MAYRARKTEHSGAKQGRGAYFGPKVEAKRESNKKRREDSKVLKLSWEETAREMAASAEDWSAWAATLADGLENLPWDRKSRK